MFKIKWKIISDTLISVACIVVLILSFILTYLYGFNQGVTSAENEYENIIAKILNQTPASYSTPIPTQVPQTGQSNNPPRAIPATEWGGPDLWQAVNSTRVQNGVNPLRQADEMCTIASIRLNELIELGKLDGHAGFSQLPEKRSDLKWIFDKYSLSEFLAFGGETAQETVNLWMNTLAHKKLLTGGEYSQGCIYAQNTFAVAIAGY